MNRVRSHAFLVLSLLILTNCSKRNQSERREQTDTATSIQVSPAGILPFSTPPNSVDGIDKWIAAIDSFSRVDTTHFLIFARLSKMDSIVQVFHREWPEDISATYNIYLGPGRKILKFVEVPFSESGDWAVSFIHYFDSSGRTRLFVYTGSFFNSECTEILRERKEFYFDTSFAKLRSVSALYDKDWKPIDSTGCIFNYDFPYVVCPNIDSLYHYLHKSILQVNCAG
jgi:hypothetical protein